MVVVVVVAVSVSCRTAAIVAVVHAAVGRLGVVEKAVQVVACVNRRWHAAGLQAKRVGPTELEVESRS